MPLNVRMTSKYNVTVIGAGPAGLSAGLEAAKNGASVCVLEHKDEPLKKLLLTGNGRCNFSNTDVNPSHYHGDMTLVASVLKDFSCDDMLDYMADELHVEALEVHYRHSENGYFYPSTNRSSTVRDAVLAKCKERDIEIETNASITELTGHKGEFHLTLTDGRVLTTENVIFACGSNSHPETGSDSSIYPVLKDLGVDFRTYLPALCAVKSQDTILKTLKGLRCDGEVLLYDITDEVKYQGETGEIQFNEHSISGLPVMQLSRFVSLGKEKKHEMQMELRIRSVNNKENAVVPEEITLNVSGTDGFKTCQCCTGGVKAREINPETLEYKKIPGIYFAGEMLDVDGECGGYNLHFAFASGILAGRSIGK